jgi:glycosyltransferase involved in cell wall biosynthesis
MLVGIDASRATVAQRTGTEGYSLHIIRGLLAIGQEHRFRLYFRDEPPADLFPAADNIEPVIIRRARLWSHTGLGPAVRHDRPDILFIPAHVAPWPSPVNVPIVFTAHDLGYLHYPEKHPFWSRIYLGWSTRYSASISRRVVAVSKATAHDLHALNGVPTDKIQVVHSGIDDLLRPATGEAVEALCSRLGIPGPYILHVGSIQPRKNLGRLVEAFRLVADEHKDLCLVLAGRLGWGYKGLLETIQHLDAAHRVILAGYVSDEDLATLYSGAVVYAFPSLYEGFGFPALEAMACGTPVICANTSSLPEIVENAALTFPPTDTTAQAAALRRVLDDEDYRQNLIKRGFERVKHFTWEAAARATLAVLEEAANT